jgi:hypothetical protein
MITYKESIYIFYCLYTLWNYIITTYFCLIIKVLLSIDYDLGIFRHYTELQISIILLKYKLYLY